MKQTPANAAKKSDRRMTVLLALVVAAAIAIALATARTSHGAGARSEEPLSASSVAMDPMAADSVASAEPQDNAVGGEVLEVLPVSKYTYLRLRGSQGEVWAAVPSAPVVVGSRVTIADATRMDDFKSATLGRTFKIIYFGTLGAGAGDALAPKYPVDDLAAVDPDEPLPPGHPDVGENSAPNSMARDPDTLPPGHPDLGTDGALSPSAKGDAPLATPQIARASGADAHVIAELVGKPHRFAGQRIRVRGQVTRVTPDVQGRTFFHLRDGNLSGGGPIGDLVVTSRAEPKRGQVATFEGTLRADVDIGIGYKYSVLLEDAVVLAE
jgi:hypothetical protein